jgi:hypothetical protein
VGSRNLVKEETLVRWGQLRSKKKIINADLSELITEREAERYGVVCFESAKTDRNVYKNVNKLSLREGKRTGRTQLASYLNS